MFRIVLIALCVLAFWTGLDGLLVSLNSSDLKSLTIETVEAEGIGEARFVEITGAVATGTYVKSVLERMDVVTEVVFPVSTWEKVLTAPDGVEPPARVFIKRTKLDGCTVENEFCIDTEARTYTGIVLTGLDSIDSDTKKAFASAGITPPPNIIFLAEGEEPQGLWYGLGLMALGLGGLAVVVALFFHRAH